MRGGQPAALLPGFDFYVRAMETVKTEPFCESLSKNASEVQFNKVEPASECDAATSESTAPGTKSAMPVTVTNVLPHCNITRCSSCQER